MLPIGPYRYWLHICMNLIGQLFDLALSMLRVHASQGNCKDFLPFCRPPSTKMSILKPQRIAVVGAGISGVVTAAHLLKHGLQVTVFERSSGPGGVWYECDIWPPHQGERECLMLRRRYDSRSSREPQYPSERPSSGDYESFSNLKEEDSRGAEDEGYSSDIEIAHAPPGFVPPRKAEESTVDI